MKTLLTNSPLFQSTKRSLDRLQTAKRYRVQFYFGLVVGLILLFSPFFYYLYRFIPEEVQSYKLFGLVTFTANQFYDAQSFVYNLFGKGIIFFALSVWYLTCKHWWKHAILPILIMTLYQLLGIINYSVSYIEEFNFYHALPVVIPIIALYIYLANWLNKGIITVDLHEKIQHELSILKTNANDQQ